MQEAWPVLELLYLTGRTIWPWEDAEPEPLEQSIDQMNAWNMVECKKMKMGIVDK